MTNPAAWHTRYRPRAAGGGQSASAVQLTVRGEDAPAGPRPQVDAHLRERCLDPEGAEVGVLLQAPDGLLDHHRRRLFTYGARAGRRLSLP
jgi:hypothetical protein